MRAIILSIGDELALGQTVDTNTAWLAAQLAQLGIASLYHQTIADDREAITDAIRLAAKQAELVLITGGLGPTEDDLTRQALASAMDRPLVMDEASLAAIEAMFTRRGRQMPDRNRTQAMHPRDTVMIPNDNGTAPGIKAQLNGATIYITPGVPREMYAMFTKSILPELRDLAGGRHVILTTKINTFGVGESQLAEMLGNLMDRQRNPKVGTTVSDGIVAVRIRSEFATEAQAAEQLKQTIEDVESRLGAIVFGRDEQTIQESTVQTLLHRKLKLTTAESCTGGLIGKMITDIPGCSTAYAGGWITYSNAMKVQQLGVEQATLDEHGAVSEPVAKAMAHGALAHSPDADLSLSVTGIAGPEGGTETKPVGTVWLGLGWRDEHDRSQIHSDAVLVLLSGDRDAVRDRAAKCSLQLLRLHLMGESLDQLQWVRKPDQPAAS